MIRNPFQCQTPQPLQRAFWIWPEQPFWNLHNGFALFRKRFILERVPEQAPFFVTADQSYRLYVNGQYVCRGPARGFQSHWPFDEVDLTEYLKPGDNILAIRACNPGHGNMQYVHAGTAGFLAGGEWGGVEIVTDKTWKCRRQTGVRQCTRPSAAPLFPQEHIDLRLEASDWMAPGFDDSEWAAAPQPRVWNAMPWSSLEPRGVPLLKEEFLRPQAILGARSGACAKGWKETKDVVETRLREMNAAGGEAREGGELEVDSDQWVSLPREGGEGGRWQSALVDFGKTVVGEIEIEVRGARGGEIVDSLFAETMDPARGFLDLNNKGWNRIALGCRLIASEGSCRHRFHHPYGFRFLEIVTRDAGAGVSVRFRFHRVGYPLRREGDFRSSDKTLEAIWETCAWTEECCSFDAYVDTPWREQAQWWGDARVQAWNTFHLCDDPRLFRRGIHCIASQTTPDGLTYGHAPTEHHGCILPDFTLIWAITLWDYYWQTGSIEPFWTHRETLRRALGYFRKQTDPATGLVGYDPRYWLFLDWTRIFKQGYPSVLNLWLLFALMKMADLHRLSGEEQEAAELDAWQAKLRRALRRLVDSRGLVRDGIKWNGEPVDECSVHSQTLAILCRLAPENQRTMLNHVIIPWIREEAELPAPPSAYWATYPFTALEEGGHGEDVVEFIRKKWTPMVAHGTTWEDWEPERSRKSFSHAWSAHPLFHLMRIIGGIRQQAPAWKEVSFSPTFIGERGGGVFPTPQGKIETTWRRDGEKAKVELVSPEGVACDVSLPEISARVGGGRHRWTVRAESNSARESDQENLL